MYMRARVCVCVRVCLYVYVGVNVVCKKKYVCMYVCMGVSVFATIDLFPPPCPILLSFLSLTAHAHTLLSLVQHMYLQLAHFLSFSPFISLSLPFQIGATYTHYALKQPFVIPAVLAGLLALFILLSGSKSAVKKGSAAKKSN